MAAIRELFFEAFAKFDFEGFNEVNKKADRLEETLHSVGEASNKTGSRSLDLRGKLIALEETLSTVGISTGSLSGLIGAMVNPITIAIGAVVALVTGIVAYIGVLRTVIGQVWEFTTSLASLGGELIRVSRSAGISAQALAAWRQAAKEANVEASAIDGALQDLSEKMGEAILQPTSETARAFRKLGISMRDIRQMSPEQAFLRIADAIRGIENPALRARLANQLLGGSGRALIPLLEQGSAHLEEYRKQLKLSQPAFDEFIRNADTLGAEQAKLNQAWEGAKQRLFNLLAPAVIYVVDKLTELVIWFNNSEEAQSAMTASLVVLAASFTTLGIVLAALSASILFVMLPAMAPLILTFIALAAPIATVILAIQDFYVFLKGGDSVFERFISWVVNTKFAVQDWLQTLLSSDSFIGGFLDGISSIANAMAKLWNLIARFTGMDQIAANFDIRRSIADAVGQAPESQAARQRARISAVEGIRMGAQDLFGVDNPAVPLGARIERQMELGAIPQPGESVARRLGGRPTQVTNNVTQDIRINIDEASDADAVQRAVRDELTREYRSLVEVLGEGI